MKHHQPEKLTWVLVSAATAAAKSLQSQTAAHQAPPSLGFSRQEHWSGLLFPSPMQESEKRKWSRSVVSRVWLLATPWTAAYQASLSMGVSRQEYWSGMPLPSLSWCLVTLLELYLVEVVGHPHGWSVSRSSVGQVVWPKVPTPSHTVGVASMPYPASLLFLSYWPRDHSQT